jgi:hypothetical protein
MRGWCWHKWSHWEDATATFSGQVKVMIQLRRCGKCNKRVTRRIYDA